MKIKLIIKKLNTYCNLFGFYPIKTYNSITGLPGYFKDRMIFSKLKSTHKFDQGTNIPCIDEKSSESGATKGHYFLTDLFVSQKIFEAVPLKHVDIGSRVDGFVAHVASFREIEVFDIRLQNSTFKNISFKKVDMMSDKLLYLNYCDSISSLHAIEHFGLGRYGDPLDPDGYLKGLQNIYKILKPNGIFYFAVPFGKQRIDFNAHRVFSLNFLLDILQSKYQLISFSYVSDIGLLNTNVQLNQNSIENNYNCNFGCAIFELKKHEIR